MATNVMEDRNYLMTLMARRPGDPLRTMAEQQLEYLNQKEGRGEQIAATRANLEENIAARRQGHEDVAAQRGLAQQQLDEYRQERLAQQGEIGKARTAQQLQFMLNDPTLAKIYGKSTPLVQKAISDAMLRGTGIEPPTGAGPGVTTTKGEYGPGGAPPPASPADATTGTVLSTAQGGAGTPEVPRPQEPNPSQVARLAPTAADIYGTTQPTPDMVPAAAIPQIYGGQPTIPEVSKVGYYDAKGGFLGPLYTETGEKLPMPKGATGLRGTASLQAQGGITETSGGGLANIPDYLKSAIAGRVPVGAPATNVATTEAMTPTPAPNLYRPDTEAFVANATTAPAPAPLAPGPTSNFNINTGFTPEAQAFLGQFLNLPKTPAQQEAERRRALMSQSY